MPGGQGPGEGARQLAGFFLFVLLLVFFSLAIRTEWERRQGKGVPWSEVLEKRRAQGRVLMPPKRREQAAPREGDVI